MSKIHTIPDHKMQENKTQTGYSHQKNKIKNQTQDRIKSNPIWVRFTPNPDHKTQENKTQTRYSNQKNKIKNQTQDRIKSNPIWVKTIIP